MLKHIVMWKLKEDEQKEQNALTIKELLEGLVGKIPELKKAEVGININRSDTAYDVVLYSEFDDEAGLAAYQSHPEHVKVGEFMKEIREKRTVVDYIL
ncbi:MAG TPA: Dabb family protein [Desulfitobacterium dehalogenans]|uniref:Dabb family protein n=1 Tax=Desulfitobacterium dehalogenans TaxID=36854 RepID=A0A7C6Z204_9FIRM|nr:Dabb family protein [Desulfitobacterium dehalogenans]